MNSRWPWNSHQRHKFLRAEASKDVWKFRVFHSRKWHFQGFSRGIFHCGYHAVSSEYTQDWEMSKGFHDISRFKHFTDLNLLKYSFNVIQNWEMDALQFFFDGDYFIIFFYGRRR